MALQLRSGLHRVWRRAGRLQVGLDSSHGVVLDGLTAADERLLDSLADGTDLPRLLSLGRRLGVDSAGVQALLAELRAGGLLAPPPTVRSRLARLPDPLRDRLSPDAVTLGIAHPEGDGWHVLAERRIRCVAVVGVGRTGLALAVGLAASGVGCVLLEDDGRVRPGDVMPGGYRDTDVGRRREHAARDLLAALCPQTRTTVRGRVRPDVVALVRHGVLAPREADGLLREDVVHLAVVWGERGVVVGPLVRPGLSSCVRCGHLHRRDRDPEWPRIVAQLADRQHTPSLAEESSLAALAAALGTGQILAHLDGATPVTVDGALEAALPDGSVTTRPWPPHPECGCCSIPVAPSTAAGRMLG